MPESLRSSSLILFIVISVLVVTSAGQAADSEVTIGLRFGATAVEQILIGATVGDIIVSSASSSPVVVHPGEVRMSIRSIDGSSTARYRLRISSFTNPLAAEKRASELVSLLGYPTSHSTEARDGAIYLYLGDSDDYASVERIKADLRVSGVSTEIDEYTVPSTQYIEVETVDGSWFCHYFEPVRVRPADRASSCVYVGSRARAYRGELEIRMGTTGLLEVINRIDVEQYLYSVVGSEMSPSYPLQALEAQAILARTIVAAARSSPRHDGFSLCDTVHCQAYVGVSGETERVRQAVEATEGLILAYGSSLAGAYYHSSCGGVTESNSVAWRADPLPYLVPVACGPDSEPPDLSDEKAAREFIIDAPESYCSDYPYYRWATTYSQSALDSLVGMTLPGLTGARPGSVGSVVSIEVLERSSSGRVMRLDIETTTGSFTLEGDVPIRSAFGSNGQLLRSAFFVIDVEADDEGTRYTFRGAGYGHGVGMCQEGAAGMAEEGFSYEEILAHFFPGTRVVDLGSIER